MFHQLLPLLSPKHYCLVLLQKYHAAKRKSKKKFTSSFFFRGIQLVPTKISGLSKKFIVGNLAVLLQESATRRDPVHNWEPAQFSSFPKTWTLRNVYRLRKGEKKKNWWHARSRRGRVTCAPLEQKRAAIFDGEMSPKLNLEAGRNFFIGK